jgi:glutathione peroxidase
MPVTRLDGRPVGAGRPGPVWRRMNELYQAYKAKGFEVLGFPSNDFGGQEPGSNAAIKDFCETNYDVDFPLFSKVGVTARNANPFHEALARATGQRPQWNFHKYLIDRSGTRVLSFASAVDPESKEIVRNVEAMLKPAAAAMAAGAVR